jgi:hypothetical protein
VWGGDGLAAGSELFGDLRARVLPAVDGGMAAAVFRVIVTYIGVDPAAAHRGGQRQLAARSPTAQFDAATGSGLASHITAHPDLSLAALQKVAECSTVAGFA